MTYESTPSACPPVWKSLLDRRAAGAMPRLVIVGNSAKPEVSLACAQIEGLLAGRAEVVARDMACDLPVARAAEDIDFFLVLGGDGTLLAAARALSAKTVPLVGIHLGHLGFLTAFTEHEFSQHMDVLLTGRLPVSRRITLDCRIVRASGEIEATTILGGPPWLPPSGIDFGMPAGSIHEDDADRSGCVLRTWAINDCVLTAGLPFRLIRMQLFVNGEPMTEVAGDGLIVATPSGSTAYNLSAGGPLIDPTVRAFVVTPVCPHSITHKPVVIDDSSVIEVVAERVNTGSTCSVDGQIQVPIRDGDRVEIRRGRHELLLGRSPINGEWQTLQERLHWGRLPQFRT